MSYTGEQFTDAIKAAVKERGSDFVYPDDWRTDGTPGACQYSTDGINGLCLIGKALELMGAPIPIGGGDPANLELENLGIEDSRVRYAAVSAQVKQDAKVTWGEALKEYLDILKSGVSAKM